MATELSFVQYVCDQLAAAGELSYKKMFGEYMVYVNNKPIILVCDNTAFVKKMDEVNELMVGASTGHPYNGAKLHYILDIDDQDQATKVVMKLEQITPLPKQKKPK
jgi:TfoX/Sxy family transcriptional regulator of competence genes